MKLLGLCSSKCVLLRGSIAISRTFHHISKLKYSLTTGHLIHTNSFVYQQNKSKSKVASSVEEKEQDKFKNSVIADIYASEKRVPTTAAEKVKEGAKTASYTAVILIAVAVTGGLFYFIGWELFSKESPTGIYDLAFKRCQDDPRLQAVLGHPIKGYGETNRRGRRRHVAHQEMIDKNGQYHILMKFYMEGPDNKAVVLLDRVKDLETGEWKYKYIIAETERYPIQTIIIEDNR